MTGLTMGSREESRALTGLRGVGAVLVMLHHFHQHLALDLRITMLAGVLRKGYLGVDLFFVLSGFVMAMVYGAWFAPGAPGRPRAYLTFLIRRIARLWPLHALVVVVVALDWTPVGQAVSPRLLIGNLAMVQAWGWSAEINPPAWSISTELLAYLLFPLLAPALLRWRWGLPLGLLATAIAIALCLHFAPPLGPGRRGRMDIYYNYSVLPALRCLAGFITGMLAWRLHAAQPVRWLASLPWTGPAALALMFALMLGRVNDLLIYPLLPLIVLGFHGGRGPVWAAFAHGPLYRLGVISYAIYLVHVALLTRFPFHAAPLGPTLAFYLAAVAAVATLAHLLVERPARRTLRRFGEALLQSMWPLQRTPD